MPAGRGNPSGGNGYSAALHELSFRQCFLGIVAAAVPAYRGIGSLHFTQFTRTRRWAMMAIIACDQNGGTPMAANLVKRWAHRSCVCTENQVSGQELAPAISAVSLFADFRHQG